MLLLDRRSILDATYEASIRHGHVSVRSLPIDGRGSRTFVYGLPVPVDARATDETYQMSSHRCTSISFSGEFIDPGCGARPVPPHPGYLTSVPTRYSASPSTCSTALHEGKGVSHWPTRIWRINRKRPPASRLRLNRAPQRQHRRRRDVREIDGGRQ